MTVTGPSTSTGSLTSIIHSAATKEKSTGIRSKISSWLSSFWSSLRSSSSTNKGSDLKTKSVSTQTESTGIRSKISSWLSSFRSSNSTNKGNNSQTKNSFTGLKGKDAETSKRVKEKRNQHSILKAKSQNRTRKKNKRTVYNRLLDLCEKLLNGSSSNRADDAKTQETQDKWGNRRTKYYKKYKLRD